MRLPVVTSVDDRGIILQLIREAKDTRRVVVIIPAHQEAASVAATIASVQRQTHAPTVIIVAANNCSDGTEMVAREAGALVFLAEPNRDKKAGALNLALDFVMDELRPTDFVLVADADTRLSDNFIEVGLAEMDLGRVGGVGGAFIGRPSSTLIGLMQGIEFSIYWREIVRHGERAFVLSGTGSLLSVAALRDVKKARQDGRLPYGTGYYDIQSLTEDNELTLALRSLGYECKSPASMTTVTDVMETFGALWQQRSRWYLGAMRNLFIYGWKLPWHLKWIYWGQQIGLMRVIVMWALQIAFITASIRSGYGTLIIPFWVILSVFVQGIKASVIWQMGWKARFATFFCEPLYNTYLLMIFCGALLQFLAGKKGSWVAT